MPDKAVGFVAALVMGVCVCLFGEEVEVPLRDGRTHTFEVVGSSERGLVIEVPQGTFTLRWDQIDPSYKEHPEHVSRAAERPGPADAQLLPVEPNDVDLGNGNGREVPVVPPFIDGFAIFLLLTMGVFWTHILAVWMVSRENLLSGARYQWLNAAVFVFGMPLALVVLIRFKGIRGLFGRRPQLAGKPLEQVGPPVCFYTWDNEPLHPKKSRKLSSGLVVAEILMARAVQANASDVHFDTTPEGVNVSFRVDGVLRKPETLAPDVGKKVITALKMAAGMDLGRVQEAQDGACQLEAGEDWYDLRVARAWAVNGETLVVRLLRTGGVGSGLTDLGMLPGMASVAKDLTQETAGIIILAGPTGSGKTTTIYALLRRMVGTGRNILTIEDPVEYRLEGATQISLNPKIGATFASALKASMRHDPDVILVGEIRDAEAMHVAFQAALTGHLVFTTIHATSVLATLGRLFELGLSAYMINTGLKAIVCQRLVRTLCPSCREPYVPDEGELKFWGLEPREEGDMVFYRPVGCKLCAESGYHGRRGVFRILSTDNEVRKMIRADVATGDLQAVVEKTAQGTVSEYAEAMLWGGVTSSEELRKTLDMFDFGKVLGKQP